MSWTDPRAEERRTRAIVRGGVLWGMLGIMILVAWLMQVGWVPVGGGGRPPQKVTSGDLTLWIPEDFLATTAPDGEIIAVQQAEGQAPAVLRAFVEPTDAVTPSMLIRERSRRDVPADSIPMGDGRGRMRVYTVQVEDSFWNLPSRREAGYQFVVSAIQEVDGRIVTIELRRPIAEQRGWNPADVSLLRRIAAHMELRKSGSRAIHGARGA